MIQVTYRVRNVAKVIDQVAERSEGSVVSKEPSTVFEEGESGSLNASGYGSKLLPLSSGPEMQRIGLAVVH
jgi:hypothetical protein